MRAIAVAACLVVLFGCSEKKTTPASVAPSTPGLVKAESKATEPTKKLSTREDAASNKALEVKDDDMEKVTWFHAKNHQRSFKKFHQWSSVKVYFGWLGKSSSFGPLRLDATSRGSDWTFARELIIKVDDAEPVSYSIYEHRKSDVGSGGVWEYYDLPLLEPDKQCDDPTSAVHDGEVCKLIRIKYANGPKLASFCSPQMMSAKKVKVRFSGDRQNTFELPGNQLEDIKAVCGAYLALVR